MLDTGETGTGETVSRLYATSLGGMKVVNMDGMVIGELENIILDMKTGKLVDLVVKPNTKVRENRRRDDGKFVQIPFEAVYAIKEYIVVDEKR